MTRSERRLLIDTGLLGVLLTLVAVALGWAGAFDATERFLHDLRARHCQFFAPPPTDRLVHLDIDDRTLEAVGAWPWPRSRLADIIDEIRLAGAKALAMDVIFSEPQPPTYEPFRQGASLDAKPGPAEIVSARVVDHDAALAESLRRFGHAIVPMSLSFNVQQSTSPLYRPMVIELFANLELDSDALTQRLRGKGFSEAGLSQDVGRLFLTAREEAMYERIAAESSGGQRTLEQLAAKLLPGMDRRIEAGSPLLRLLERQHERYRSVRLLQRFGRPVGADLPPLVNTRDEQATLSIFSQAAGATGYVDYIPASDGVVRAVPLWAVHREWMYPQMGLALACAALDIEPRQVVVRDDAVVLPHPEGPIVIPVRKQRTARGTFGMFFDVPYFGGSAWETMYDYPRHEQPRQHMPLGLVWEACVLRQRIVQNNRAIDSAVSNLLDNDQEYKLALDPARAKRYFAALPDLNDPTARKPIVEWTLRESGAARWLDRYEKLKDSDLDNNDRFQRDMLRQSWQALENGLEENQKLLANLEQRRAELRSKLGGRAALMGWTATGAIADVVPTSLHPRCPGVVVHGVIFNAILTGDFWRRAPHWVTLLITLGMGLLTTGVVASLSPWRALAATFVLCWVYLAFNAFYLFDRHNLIVGAAEPMAAAAIVWAGGTLARFILEASLRAKIKRRFEVYADPALVNHIMETDARLDGQVKELTVAFTDLGGFTTLTERLGEQTVPLLNRYMSLMVPVIHGRRGYLNKFLGDGIMFFFGAPTESPNHAHDAVASVLEMLEVMGPFNDQLARENLPQLSLRAGIASGEMVVGDAGSEHRSDYTVLGDTVNLGARLEPANKVFGTQILINARARELAGDGVLARPIGKIQVLGKAEGVMVHEALNLVEKATDQQRQLAELTEPIVARFLAGDLPGCLEAIERMEAFAGISRLTALYRGLCERHLREGQEGFDGQIVLTSK